MDETLKKATDQVATLLESVGDNRTEPTPCRDWDLGVLVDHVVATPANFAAMARGETVDWAANPDAGGNPAQRFRDHVTDLEDALEQGEGFPPGMMLAELGVHTYDLATTFESPTGQLDPDVAEKALAFMQENLKPEIRGDAFDEEKPAPRDADAYQRLAAFAGRDVA